ncbi:DUF1684 domain-containing protein [Streptomyces subrutilus]|uniref:DUF1684 domain-containing protein n=1 Tax=Streptomyces subrutilus TaxID=36818 RepID=UPI0033F781F1
MSDDADDPPADWRKWHERRVASASAPGRLALAGALPQAPSGGTPGLADYPEGRIPAVPGRRRATGVSGVPSAAAEDSVQLDAEPFAGEVELAAEEAPPARSRPSAGERRLVVARREGRWAVRVFDRESETRRALPGPEASPYDPAFRLAGRFRPYGEDRTVQVANTDGRARGLGLGGEPRFPFEDVEHTLQVIADEEDGSLWAVFGDGAGARSGHRFRFPKPGAPAEDGSITVDSHRALPPPRALTDHFICPFPPSGDTLPCEAAAGERRLKGALADR